MIFGHFEIKPNCKIKFQRDNLVSILHFMKYHNCLCINILYTPLVRFSYYIIIITLDRLPNMIYYLYNMYVYYFILMLNIGMHIYYNNLFYTILSRIYIKILETIYYNIL